MTSKPQQLKIISGFIFVFICSGALSLNAQGVFFNGHLQSADLHSGMNVYEIALAPQITFRSQSGRGFGFNGHFMMPISSEIAGNFSMGTGIVPFLFDGHLQYNILPDYPEHIAFGIGGGIHYLREDKWNHVTPYLYPTISKTLDWGGFVVTPYVLIPLGLTFYRDKVQFPLKATLGTRMTNKDLKNVFFFLEGGFGILNAPIQVAFGLSFQFESG